MPPTELEYDFGNQDTAGLAEAVAQKLSVDLAQSREDSYAEREEFFDYDSLHAVSIDEGLAMPGYSQAESTEVMESLVATNRYLLAEQQLAENNKVAAKTALTAEGTRLLLAQRDVVTEQVVNAGKQLEQEFAKGQLIDQRTLGFALKAAHQQHLNNREFELIQLAAEQTDAMIQGAQVEIDTIRSATEQKMLAAREQALTAAGIDVAFKTVS